MSRRSRLTLTLVAFLGMGLGLQGSASVSPPPGFFGSFHWQLREKLFGGLSALEVSKDGQHFTAVSDRGSFVSGSFIRDGEGHIVGIRSNAMQRLKSGTDAPLVSPRNDSEGLAIAPDGTAYISFEGAARVLKYDHMGGHASNLPTPPEFALFPSNTSLEALAIDAKGALYTMPEELAGSKRIRLFTGQPGNPNGPDFPVWKFDGKRWTQPFDLPRRGSFLPVGADFGPNGRLYILERQFRGIAGFGSRVRSFVVGHNGLTGERMEMESPIGLHDNLEGLSVWQDRAGHIRLTMVSDDNFLPIQRTEIVEYRLND